MTPRVSPRSFRFSTGRFFIWFLCYAAATETAFIAASGGWPAMLLYGVGGGVFFVTAMATAAVIALVRGVSHVEIAAGDMRLVLGMQFAALLTAYSHPAGAEFGRNLFEGFPLFAKGGGPMLGPAGFVLALLCAGAYAMVVLMMMGSAFMRGAEQSAAERRDIPGAL